MTGLAALLLTLLTAANAAAEIYRCEEPGGALRFSGDPRACPGAEVVSPDPARVQSAPSAPGRVEPRTAPRPAGGPARLAELLPPTPKGWEATREAVAVERDAALRARGLLASVARHYGRAEGAVSWLCTVEIWWFASASQAQAARATLDLPRETIRASGPALVFARGIRMEREVGPTRGVFPECGALAASVSAERRRP